MKLLLVSLSVALSALVYGCDGCDFTWSTPLTDKRLRGFDSVRVAASSLAECVALCEAQTTFICKSIEFSAERSICVQQQVYQKDHSSDFIDKPGFVYQERKCAGGIPGDNGDGPITVT